MKKRGAVTIKDQVIEDLIKSTKWFQMGKQVIEGSGHTSIVSAWAQYHINNVAKLTTFLCSTSRLPYHDVNYKGGASWSNAKSVVSLHYETKRLAYS